MLAVAFVLERVGSQGPMVDVAFRKPSALGIQKKIKFDLEKLKKCDFLISYLGSKAHTSYK